MIRGSILILCASMTLSGCKWEFGLKDLVTASENLHKASKDLDPIKIGQLLNENEELRKQLADWNQKYAEAMGTGALEVAQKQLFWRVSDYKAALRVVVKIRGSSESITVSESELSDRAAACNFNANEWLFRRPDGAITRRRVAGPNFCLGFDQRGLDAELQQHIGAVCGAALSAQPLPASSAPKEIWLNPRFPQTGLHEIEVEVTPRAGGASKWVLVWELVTRDSDNKNEKVLASFNMNSEVDRTEASKSAKRAAKVLVRVATKA